MNQEELTRYKELLEKTKAELEKKLAALPVVTDMGSDTEGTSQDEEADETEQMADNLAVRENFKQRLNTINEALEKIQKGAYGQCENCAGAVEKKVLEASPESKLCQNCK